MERRGEGERERQLRIEDRGSRMATIEIHPQSSILYPRFSTLILFTPSTLFHLVTLQLRSYTLGNVTPCCQTANSSVPHPLVVCSWVYWWAAWTKAKQPSAGGRAGIGRDAPATALSILAQIFQRLDHPMRIEGLINGDSHRFGFTLLWACPTPVFGLSPPAFKLRAIHQ
jgi:hypothetical protein